MIDWIRDHAAATWIGIAVVLAIVEMLSLDLVLLMFALGALAAAVAAGLDLGAREDLMSSLEILSAAPDSPVLVMVSHHVEEIPVGFTHVLMLRGGRVVAQGPIESTLTADALGATFGLRLELQKDGGRFSARRAAYGHRADRRGEAS